MPQSSVGRSFAFKWASYLIAWLTRWQYSSLSLDSSNGTARIDFILIHCSLRVIVDKSMFVGSLWWKWDRFSIVYFSDASVSWWHENIQLPGDCAMYVQSTTVIRVVQVMRPYYHSFSLSFLNWKSSILPKRNRTDRHMPSGSMYIAAPTSPCEPFIWLRFFGQFPGNSMKSSFVIRNNGVRWHTI